MALKKKKMTSQLEGDDILFKMQQPQRWLIFTWSLYAHSHKCNSV